MALPERLAQCIATCDRTDPVTPAERLEHERLVREKLIRDRNQPQAEIPLRGGSHA